MQLSQGFYQYQALVQHKRKPKSENPRFTLTPKRKEFLNLLLSQEELKDSGFKGISGWAGIQKAHEMLIAHNERGILIGGLASAIYQKGIRQADLDNHKNTNVAVFRRHTHEKGEKFTLKYTKVQYG